MTAADAVRSHYGLEVAVAAHRLEGSSTSFPDAPLSDQEWATLLERVQEQWIWRLLGAAVADGALPCSADQAAQARAGAGVAAMNDLRVESRLVHTAALLDTAGVGYRAMKGATTASRVYRDASLRSFGDVDILVDGASFDAVVGLLERNGGLRRFREVRPGFDRQFSKGASFRMPDGVTVDLHRTFVLGPYGFTIDLPGVLARRDTITVAGAHVSCLELHDAAVHACIHATLGGWPPFLTSMRDVVQFLIHPAVDPDLVLARAREWRVLAVLARAVVVAGALYGIDGLPLAVWASEYRPERWEQRAIALYGERHNFRSQALAATRFVPGLAPKLAYVRGLAFPESGYLREREGSYLRRAMRAVGISHLIALGRGRARR